MKIKKPKNNYVKRDFIAKIDAEYIIILGQRSNGKSFAVKEDIIKRALESGEEFAYIRRYKEDCKQYMIEEYFSDIVCDKEGVRHLEEWSNGRYNYISVYQQGIYLAYITEEGKVTRGQKLGRMFGLSWDTHYKSLSFPNITTAVYEEFVTDGAFLENESKRFMHLISTIFRTSKARVYLVGNSISRINPFFSEWQLLNIPKQKPNSVDMYYHKYMDENDEEQSCKIAVYLTHSTNINSGMFFGNAAKAITGSVWDTDEQPHLKGKKSDYEVLYTVVFIYDRTLFLLELLQHIEKGYIIWFVSPKNTPPQKDTRIVCNKLIPDNLATVGFIPLSEQERYIFKMLIDERVCFSDNLTGTEFKQCFNAVR